ncbi:MAG: hypothetical protein M1839_007971 [Geoglossum umbratile]|nr:MAG: hypothetical protein M1839_007971 [Geoglossum umbratile]
MATTGERWWWISVGFLTVFAVRTVSRQLHEIRKLVRVTEDEARPNVIGQDTEDGETKFWMKRLSRISNVEAQALKLATLETLSKGLSYELRVAALKIILERGTRESLNQLLKQVGSKNDQTRTSALQVLKLLSQSSEYPPICLSSIKTAEKSYQSLAPHQSLGNINTFRALVQALHYHVPPHATEADHRPPHLRTPSERNAMYVLARLIPYNVSEALKAGVVTRWLAKYPFGDTEHDRREMIRALKTWSAQDMLLSEIVCAIEGHPDGRKQMRMAGLTGSAMGEPDSDGDERIIRMVEDTEAILASGLVSRRGLRNASSEERVRRRRRREAMVLSDGVEPIGSNDIIQQHPTDFRRDEEEAAINQEMERLMEQVLSTNAPGRAAAAQPEQRRWGDVIWGWTGGLLRG